MNIKSKLAILLLVILTFSSLVTATILEGTVYNDNLEVEEDVLIEINTVPKQKFLAYDGKYSLSLPPGEYTLTAQKGNILVVERIEVVDQGKYVYDLFLLPSFIDEEELWNESEEEYFSEEEDVVGKSTWWKYCIGGVIFIVLLVRFFLARKKFGPLAKFRRRMKANSRKSIQEVKKELAEEPGHVDKALEIIKKHDGRITQKKLRREMLYLSEAKVSLILTELEHKGLVEKVKKGRGNVVLLK